MNKSSYLEKLKDPRWQKKRLQILERDGWKCAWCDNADDTLHVHHLWYGKNQEPWESDTNSLITLCEFCHEWESENRKHDEEKLLLILREKHWTSIQISNLADEIMADVLTAKMIEQISIKYIQEHQSTEEENNG
jgi:5-methylcytosine-specific restriction endonuclease McrA